MATVVVCLLCGVLASQAEATAPQNPVEPAAVAVLGCPPGATTVPADYLGVSIEWSMVAHWFGTGRSSFVAPMVSLLRSLRSTAATAGVLRIGGNSQDGYRWQPDNGTAGNQAFSGVVNRGMVDALLEVARRSRWRIILGANLRANSPAETVGLVHYAVSQDRDHRLLAVELGNEPTAYFGTDGRAYLARFREYTQALRRDPVTWATPVTGPALANEASLSFLTQLNAAYPGRLPFLTWHHYANEPTLSKLLDESVTTRWTNRIAQVRQAAGSTAIRMDEGNSVGGGGLDGVSNVMGSSAWLADTLLSGAQAGLAGFNLHAWDSYYYPGLHRSAWYTPFVVRDGLTFPGPVFYGLALLRDMAGKRFCTTSTGPRQDEVKSWALIDPVTQHLSVYLVRKGGAGTRQVNIALPAGYSGTALLSRIQDSGGCTGRDTGINGVRLPTNGRFSWDPSPVPAQAGTSYTVELGPCQTALLATSAG